MYIQLSRLSTARGLYETNGSDFVRGNYCLALSHSIQSLYSCLFIRDNQTTVDTRTAQEPSIYTGPTKVVSLLYSLKSS